MARQRILEAAAEVAELEGAQALSLDRVAERAEVSKGGLLYHFRSKEALIHGLLEQQLACHDAVIRSRIELGQRYSEAVIEQCFEKHAKPQSLMAAFIAAIAVDKDCREVIRAKKREWFEALLNDGVPRDRALVITLVMDGLFVGSSLGVSVLEPEEVGIVQDALLEMLQPTEVERLAGIFSAAFAQMGASEVLRTEIATTGAI